MRFSRECDDAPSNFLRCPPMLDCFNDDAQDDTGCTPLDELMCEYVDGTMDTSVRRVFDEFLTANPEIACQVEDLRRTRMLLLRRGHGTMPDSRLHDRVKCRVACAMVEEEIAPWWQAADRLAGWAAFTSSALVLALIGLAAGAFVGEYLVAAGEPPEEIRLVAGKPDVQPVPGAVFPSGFSGRISPAGWPESHAGALILATEPAFIRSASTPVDDRP
jgi:hypothetical protein